eukprot:m.387481 g.387481  ORF g.387481 m.387481 type:complete len:153 (-) comp21030_c0_seq12:880-1338(-)
MEEGSAHVEELDAFDEDGDEYLFDDPGSPKWSGDPSEAPSDQYVPTGEPKDYDNLEPWNVQDDTEGLGALVDLYKRPEVKRIESMQEILDHDHVTMYLASDATENGKDIEELNKSVFSQCIFLNFVHVCTHPWFRLTRSLCLYNQLKNNSKP